MREFVFSQVDVFSSVMHYGNPVAVVHDADSLSDEDMAVFARWTNLSETTFLLKPTQPEADYRLRIFTPGGELPFAGHPTLGSCHAWLEQQGGAENDSVIQECEAGLIEVRRTDDVLAFAAPPLIRSGSLESQFVTSLLDTLQLEERQLIDHHWIVNGPNWCGLLLDSAATVLALNPDMSALKKVLDGVALGVIGAQERGVDTDFEVRAFVPDLGVPEDPVTGSLNAGLAQWLIGAKLAPSQYIASQGTAIGRAGIVRLQSIDDTVWVGGECLSGVRGSVMFAGN